MFEFNDNTQSLGELCHPPHPVSFIPFAPAVIQEIAVSDCLASDELNFLMNDPETLRCLAKRLRDKVDKYNMVQWGLSYMKCMSPEAAIAKAEHYQRVAREIEISSRPIFRGRN